MTHKTLQNIQQKQIKKKTDKGFLSDKCLVCPHDLKNVLIGLVIYVCSSLRNIFPSFANQTNENKSNRD